MINFALYNAVERMLALYRASAAGAACEHEAAYHAERARRITDAILYVSEANA